MEEEGELNQMMMLMAVWFGFQEDARAQRSDVGSVDVSGETIEGDVYINPLNSPEYPPATQHASAPRRPPRRLDTDQLPWQIDQTSGTAGRSEVGDLVRALAEDSLRGGAVSKTSRWSHWSEAAAARTRERKT